MIIFNTAVIAIAIVALFTSPSDLNIDESTDENKNTINNQAVAIGKELKRAKLRG